MSKHDACSWGTCPRLQYAKGFCKVHYDRDRWGKPMDPPIGQARKVNTSTTCTYPGCPRPRGNNGTLNFCQAHQERNRTGKDMDAPIADKRRGTVQERVYRRLPDVFTEECSEWQGRLNDAGYGIIRTGGRDEPGIRVTNVVYEMFVGPIPDEHRLVRHTCHNPPCVNPNHLVSGTDGDNMTDKMLAGRAAKKLTPDDVLAIRKDVRSARIVGKIYGVSKTEILFIRKRQHWSWVED